MAIGHYLWSAVLILLTVVAFYVVLPAYRDYRAAQRDRNDMHLKISKQEQEILGLRRKITARKTDPRAVERIAREKFGWCRNGEKVYHFDPPASDGAGTGGNAPGGNSFFQ